LIWNLLLFQVILIGLNWTHLNYHFGRQSHGGGLHKRMPGSDEKSFGVMVNSFYDLDSFRNELGNTAWIVGPVSLCNRNVEDKGWRRGQKTSVNDEQTIFNWLDVSVICFLFKNIFFYFLKIIFNIKTLK